MRHSQRDCDNFVLIRFIEVNVERFHGREQASGFAKAKKASELENSLFMYSFDIEPTTGCGSPDAVFGPLACLPFHLGLIGGEA